jgi:hypothetical protein
MSTFSVHTKDSGQAESVVVVREGFSLSAFVFGPLAHLLRRMWLALALWIAAAILGVLVAVALGGGAGVGWGVALLLFYLLALEDGSLRRAALRRRGYTFADVVEAQSANEARMAFAYRQATRQPAVVASEPRRREPTSGHVGLLFGGV